MTISQAWNGLFQKFQSLELIVLIVIFVDFTLACYQPNIQRCIMFTGTVTSTHSFLYLSCSGVSACLGWRTSCISLSTPFKFLIISFFSFFHFDQFYFQASTLTGEQFSSLDVFPIILVLLQFFHNVQFLHEAHT